MKPKAFTLVELLVVLAIIGILSSFIYVQTNNAINSGKDSKRKSDVALLASGVHVYSIGSELIASSGCNIGSTCSTEINESLTAQLGPLPSEPDSGKSYIYESDGTDCTISAVLSDGQTYQYSCSQDAMSQSSPINGECGSAVNHGSYTIPTSNFCSDGYTPTISGSGPWTWSCPGSYLGSPASCTAYKSVDGVCDASTDGSNTYTAPTNLCTAGIASSVSTGSNPTNYFTWSCNGEHDGTTDSCSANLKVSGVCDSSATSSSYYLSSEIVSPCSSGTASSITTGSTTFTWTCSGVNEGEASGTCTANKKINGQCGAANGGWYESPPTSNLCSYGNPSTSGSWSWTCLGINGGTNSPTTCTANQRQTCSALGGTMTMCGSVSCCQLSMSSCPSGWSYTGYNSTNRSSYGSNGVCESVSHDPNGYAVACGASYCYYSGYHTWTTTSNSSEWVMRNNWCGLGTYYWYSTIYSVGCY